MIDFNDVLEGFKEAYRRHIEDSGHRASGNLGNSMTWDAITTDNGYRITITLPDYALYLEEGTKPHWPNVDAIKNWIVAKKIIPRPLPSGKLPTENQLAYLIGRKISKVGTEPTHLIKNTMSDFELISKLTDLVAKSIEEELIEIIKK